MTVQRGSLDADIGVVGAGPAGSLLAIEPAGTPGLGEVGRRLAGESRGARWLYPDWRERDHG